MLNHQASAAPRGGTTTLNADMPSGEDIRRQLLYKLVLTGDLQKKASQTFGEMNNLCRILSQSSQGAWNFSSQQGKASSVNGASPLEISLSTRDNALRFCSCVGLPGQSPYQRQLLAIDQAETISRQLMPVIPDSLQHGWHQLRQWSQKHAEQQTKQTNGFGAYLGFSLSKQSLRIKLYLDLIAQEKHKALSNWQDLLQRLNISDNAEMENLLNRHSTPSMGFIEWNAAGHYHCRLYRQLDNPQHNNDFSAVLLPLGLDELHKKASTVFTQACQGWPSIGVPAGLVYPSDWDGSSMGLYSASPSRQLCTSQKKTRLATLWQAFGGDTLALQRYWALIEHCRRKTGIHHARSAAMTILALAQQPLSKQQTKLQEKQQTEQQSEHRLTAYFST
ncbi:hypothetical protein R50073_07830 [Maricurvus nonylphenolicus]|uniref:hypothetical protein n=1 Tax=Maricurvus nonylphenolicus TaxID=1008307 RepID=UPI0036F36DF3